VEIRRLKSATYVIAF